MFLKIIIFSLLLYCCGKADTVKFTLDIHQEHTRFSLDFYQNAHLKPTVRVEKDMCIVLFPCTTTIDKPKNLSALPSYIQKIEFTEKNDQTVMCIKNAPGTKVRPFFLKNKTVIDIVREKIILKKEEIESLPSKKEQKNVHLVSFPQVGDTPAHLEFRWKQPVAMAALQRNRNFWLVFDQKAKINLPSPQQQKRLGIYYLKIYEDDKFLVVQGALRLAHHIHVFLQDHCWIVQVTPYDPLSLKKVDLSVMQDEHHKKKLLLKVKEEATFFKLKDAFSGNDWTFVPLKSTKTGVSFMHKMQDLNILVAEQGLVLEHISPHLIVEKGITISSKHGLRLSSQHDREKACLSKKPGPLIPWETVQITKQKKQNLFQKIRQTPSHQRAKLRYKLFHLLMHKKLYRDAMAQLELAVQENPQLRYSLPLVGFLSMAYILEGSYEKAKTIFRENQLPEQEFAPWKAILLTVDNQSPQRAYTLFMDGQDHIDRYPPAIRNFIALKAAEVCMRVQKSPLPFLNKMDMHIATQNEKDLKLFFQTQSSDYKESVENKSYLLSALIKKASHPSVKTYAFLKQLDLSQIPTDRKIALLEAKKLSVAEGYPRQWALELLLSLYKETNNLSGILHTLDDLIFHNQHVVDKRKLIQEAQRIFCSFFEANNLHSPKDKILFFDHFKHFLPSDKRRILIIFDVVKQFKKIELMENAKDFLEIFTPQIRKKDVRDKVYFTMAELSFYERQYAKMSWFLNQLNDPEKYAKSALKLRVDALLSDGKYVEGMEMLRDTTDPAYIESISRIMLKQKFWYPLLDVSEHYLTQETTDPPSPGLLRTLALFEYHGHEAVKKEKNRLQEKLFTERERLGLKILQTGFVQKGKTNREQFTRTIHHALKFEEKVKHFLKASLIPKQPLQSA